jgi:hypothetical protein
MTLEIGYILQPTNTPWDMHQYRAAAEHVAAENGGVLTGEPTLVYPDQYDTFDVPEGMRGGVPLLRWTWGKQGTE